MCQLCILTILGAPLRVRPFYPCARATQVRRAPDEDDCIELLSGGESLRVHAGGPRERDELFRAFSVVLACEVQNLGLLAELIGQLSSGVTCTLMLRN